MLLISLALVTVTGCGRATEFDEAEYTNKIDTPVEQCDRYDDTTSNTIESVSTQLTYLHFIEDIDYLLDTMENNFSAFSVAYWAHGVDITSIFHDLRSLILSNPEICLDGFAVNLIEALVPLRATGISHFTLFSPRTHEIMYNNPMDSIRQAFSINARNRLFSHHAMSFYEPRYNPTHIFNCDDAMDALLLSPPHELPERSYVNTRTEGQENVITEIIQDNYIAYLSIHSFWGYFTTEREQILNFYETIYDFDHLIIDLRGNIGGMAPNFSRYVMGPIIADCFIIDGFVFVKDGIYAEEYIRRVGRDGRVCLLGNLALERGLRRDMSSPFGTVDEILSIYDLPNINMDDMSRMDYGFRVYTTVDHRPQRQLDSQPFNGEIWLLTDSPMGSAAQLAAWIAKDTGFATLVGDITGGMFGGPRTVVVLPNTGIAFQMDLFYVTDRYGRPLDAGTIPHYFNLEGLDAMETVLQMIEEGLY